MKRRAFLKGLLGVAALAITAPSRLLAEGGTVPGPPPPVPKPRGVVIKNYGQAIRYICCECVVCRNHEQLWKAR